MIIIKLMAYFEERATTAIYIRVKRLAETYFVLCDEYETVESVKGRLVLVLEKIKFTLPKQEEPLSCDDIRLCLKNRVRSFHLLSLGSRQRLKLPRPAGFQRHGALLLLPQAGH